MVFPGCYLHGVLPCNTGDNIIQERCSNEINSDNGNDFAVNGEAKSDKNGVGSCMKSTLDDSHKEENPLQRLTFMVGFWTRCVPDNMGDDRPFYSPCGEVPPPLKEHSWVEDIVKGYPLKSHDYNTKIDEKCLSEYTSQSASLPTVTPAWECLGQDDPQSSTNYNDEGSSESRMTLEIPNTLDHRFFVTNCPSCFRDSLFQKDDSFC